jgi:F0F1-type ATP synthase epsilon subunit
MSQSAHANSETATISIETFSHSSSGKITAAWVEIDSPSGHFVVGPGHTETISLIRPGSTIVYQAPDGNQGSFVAPGGLAIIQNNIIKLILYSSL